LTIALWDKIYEKLFGGFEDLSATAKEDEEEEDELQNVPSNKKTKDGYLKDGFVVDSSDGDDEDKISSTDESDDIDESYDEDTDEQEDPDCDAVIEDLGSELSEDSYDYESDSDKNEK
jgi:hypothetical protein